MFDGLDFIINILFIIESEMCLFVSKKYVCCLKYCEICIIVFLLYYLHYLVLNL